MHVLQYYNALTIGFLQLAVLGACRTLFVFYVPRQFPSDIPLQVAESL